MVFFLFHNSICFCFLQSLVFVSLALLIFGLISSPLTTAPKWPLVPAFLLIAASVKAVHDELQSEGFSTLEWIKTIFEWYVCCDKI
jgi:hypothetical protein